MGLYPRKSRCGARSRGREISVAKAISFGHIGPRRADAKFYKAPGGLECGCSSGVEHNLAKVRVEGSNPFARSNILPVPQGCDDKAGPTARPSFFLPCCATGRPGCA